MRVFQDKRLNSSYRKLASSLSSPQREELRVEELAWVQHKESYCAPEQGAGQGQETTSADCLVGETAKRATEIEARIK
ncbi:MAG: lysozyme inhibitor LprI family protein [Luteibacter sp.]